MSMSEVVNSIEHEMFDMATKRNCGNCKWWAEFEGVCCNGDNKEKVADFTDRDYVCPQHTLKENR